MKNIEELQEQWYDEIVEHGMQSRPEDFRTKDTVEEDGKRYFESLSFEEKNNIIIKNILRLIDK